MDAKVARLVGGEVVLVSTPVDSWRQAVMSGVLELSSGYVCPRDGDSCNVVLLPEGTELIEGDAGPVFLMLGGQYAVGDRVTAEGGAVPATQLNGPAPLSYPRMRSSTCCRTIGPAEP